MQFRGNKSRVAAPKNASGIFWIPRSYAVWTIAQIAIFLFLIAALFQTIFLTQHFIDIFKDTADEIGSLADVFWLVLLTAPEVQFALPVAVLAAFYAVTLRSRERRELIVLAGSGVGVRQIIALALVIGLGTQILSLLITGIVLPHARFAFRRDVYTLRLQAIGEGGVGGHFYSFPNYTLFKWPSSSGTTEPHLFIYQKSAGSSLRQAISVQNAQVMESPLRANTVNMMLNGITAIAFSGTRGTPADTKGSASQGESTCPTCAPSPEKMFHVDNYARSFDLDKLVQLEPRGAVPAEWTSAELFAAVHGSGGGGAAPEYSAEMASRFVRGFLCLIAPFFAIMAVSYTNRLTRALALPVACALILCLEIGGLAAAQALAPLGLTAIVIGTVFIFGCCLAIVIWQISVRESAIIKPALSKA